MVADAWQPRSRGSADSIEGMRALLLARSVERDGCRVWLGGHFPGGYGCVRWHGRVVGTHRVAWSVAHGPIPAGMQVLHHCDNPPCIKTEPDERYPEGHLFLGTNLDNQRDRRAKGRGYWQLRITHCTKGHPLTPDNVYDFPSQTTRRKCRTCAKARAKAYYDAHHRKPSLTLDSAP